MFPTVGLVIIRATDLISRLYLLSLQSSDDKAIKKHFKRISLK